MKVDKELEESRKSVYSALNEVWIDNNKEISKKDLIAALCFRMNMNFNNFIINNFDKETCEKAIKAIKKM